MSEMNVLVIGSPIVNPEKWETLEGKQRDAVHSSELSSCATKSRTPGHLWKPLYITALVAMVINVVLSGVSVAIDIIEVSTSYYSQTPFSPFADVCASGCDAFNSTAVGSLLVDGTYYGTGGGWYEQLDRMVASVEPFRVSSCLPSIDDSKYRFFASSESHRGVGGTILVHCPSENTTPMGYASTMYGLTYMAGATSYHIPGEPRIYGADTLLTGWIEPVMSFFFVFGGIALILHIAALALRAKLGPNATRGQDTYPCGTCCCTGPQHTRNLLIAVLTSMAANIVVTISQLAVCESGTTSSPVNEGGTESFTTLGGYYAVLAIMLVMEFLALGCVAAAVAVLA